MTDPTQYAPAGHGLVDRYDAVLFDLDGTLRIGGEPIPGTPEILAQVRPKAFYLTNNARSSAAAVAEQLTGLGFTATSEQVITSAQAAAHLLATRLDPGAPVLVVGSDSLADEVTGVGLTPVRSFDDRPVAVVQGFSPDVGWRELAEATYALNDGALWIASNLDATLPTERGMALGNGSLVAALRHATGREPEVAGKPYAPIFTDALRRVGSRNVLVVGDRIDTDIAGAAAAGLDSLLVLTGVTTREEATAVPVAQRPTYLAEDLGGLLRPASASSMH